MRKRKAEQGNGRSPTTPTTPLDALSPSGRRGRGGFAGKIRRGLGRGPLASRDPSKFLAWSSPRGLLPCTLLARPWRRAGNVVRLSPSVAHGTKWESPLLPLSSPLSADQSPGHAPMSRAGGRNGSSIEARVAGIGPGSAEREGRASLERRYVSFFPSTALADVPLFPLSLDGAGRDTEKHASSSRQTP